MKIILLSGQPNKGKTCTLKLLYCLLLGKGGIIVDIHPFGTPKANQKKCFLKKDIKCAIKFGDKKVCLYTEGDYGNSIPKALEYARAQKADVLIAACNNNEHINLKSCGTVCLTNTRQCDYKGAGFDPSDIWRGLLKTIVSPPQTDNFVQETSEVSSNIEDCKKLFGMI